MAMLGPEAGQSFSIGVTPWMFSEPSSSTLSCITESRTATNTVVTKHQLLCLYIQKPTQSINHCVTSRIYAQLTAYNYSQNLTKAWGKTSPHQSLHYLLLGVTDHDLAKLKWAGCLQNVF